MERRHDGSHGDMDMGMGGMDMGSASLFQITNKKIAKLYWYFIAAVVAVCVVRRTCDILRTIYAKRKNESRSEVPSRPTNFVARLYDSTIAVCRELTYPQFRPFTGSVSKYFSTLPLGQTLLLLAYWVMILIMLWSNVILSPSSMIYGYKWEIVGFRAAWVSVTQLPLIYCLGGKANIISLLTGISYERLNWLHRWVARTIFLTIIVHWSYFFREWWLADFVKDELEMMPMVKYGFGAWAVIGWSVITGFGFFRSKSYELWVLQHLATAGVLLWLLYVHVPSYARYNIWLSIGFVVFDRGVRGIWSLIRNLHVGRLWQKVSGNQSLIGFKAKVESHRNGYASLTIDNVDFSWRPGQHVFISMPMCGVFESHPFTISNLSSPETNSLELYFKCHLGFTGRLRKRAEAGKAQNIRTFVSGPWGNPPTSRIERCNSLVFVASSTGASFTVPLLEHAIREAKFVQRICFLWIVRHDSQLKTFMPRIMSAIEAARQLNIEAECRVFITDGSVSPSSQSVTDEKNTEAALASNESSQSITSSEDSVFQAKQHIADHKDVITTTRSASSNSHDSFIEVGQISVKEYSNSSNIVFNHGRPESWDQQIHPVLVEAEGETVIVACGGTALMADIRNYVAWISDQRAVHKGTGAQGISLYTETYGW